MALRASASIDKDGRKSGTTGCNEAEAQLTSATSMGWFPGYAIEMETGERLNIGYGENSFWGGEIGRDMKWNPNDQLYTTAGAPFFGGSHWIYIFKNDRRILETEDRVPMYDEGQYIRTTMQGNGAQSRLKTFRAISWVGSAMVAQGAEFLSTDVRIILNVTKAYGTYLDYDGNPAPIVPERNNGLPLYAFATDGIATVNNDLETAKTALDLITFSPTPGTST